jgi:hypothetical protein
MINIERDQIEGARMPNHDKKNELARDAGEATIERSVAGGLEWFAKVDGISEVSEAVPYVGLVIKMVKWGLETRDSRRCREFFRDLAAFMGNGSADEAAEHVARHMQHDWAREGVVRGIRGIMEAVDEDARRCIAVLVADYFVRHAVPDLVHKRVASLLLDSDAQSLSLLRALLELYPSAPSEERFVALIAGSREGYFGKAWFVPAKQGEVPPARTAGMSRVLCDQVCAQLVNHGFATTHVGFGGSSLGSEIALVPTGMHSGVILLRDCLRTAGIAVRCDEPDPSS